MSSLLYDTIIVMNTNKISFNKYVAEIIGTLMLVLVVALSGQWGFIFAGIALALIVYLFGGISGAHVNPAFTIAACTMKKIRWQEAILYVCSQLIGAGIAIIILKSMPAFTFSELTSSPDFSWGLTLLSEIVGTFVFALAFSAALHGKTNSGNVGMVIGLGLFLGLLFANIAGGPGFLNPAVALGIGAIHWVTVLGSIIGALLGAWVYRWMVVYPTLSSKKEEVNVVEVVEIVE